MNFMKIIIFVLSCLIYQISYAHNWMDLGQAAPGVTWSLDTYSIKSNKNITSGLLRWNIFDGTTRDEIWSFNTRDCKSRVGKYKTYSEKLGESTFDFDIRIENEHWSNGSGVVAMMCKIAGKL